MSLISFTPVTDGSTATAAGVNTPLSTIYNDHNGNITDANIAANAAIAGSKVNYASVANPYKFWAYQNSAQTVSVTSTDTKVNLQASVFDTGSNFSNSTMLFTAPATGFYFFSWSVTMVVATNSIITTLLYVNGAATNGIAGTSAGQSTGGNQTKPFTGAGLLQLTAGDTVGLYVNVGNTGAMNAFRSQTYLQGFLLSAT